MRGRAAGAVRGGGRLISRFNTAAIAMHRQFEPRRTLALRSSVQDLLCDTGMLLRGTCIGRYRFHGTTVPASLLTLLSAFD